MNRPQTDRLISTSMILENKLKLMTGIKTTRQVRDQSNRLDLFLKEYTPVRGIRTILESSVKKRLQSFIANSSRESSTEIVRKQKFTKNFIQKNKYQLKPSFNKTLRGSTGGQEVDSPIVFKVFKRESIDFNLKKEKNLMETLRVARGVIGERLANKYSSQPNT